MEPGARGNPGKISDNRACLGSLEKCPALDRPPPQKTGGEGEIRTPGTREGSLVFETSPFGRSGTSPPRSGDINPILQPCKEGYGGPGHSLLWLLFSLLTRTTGSPRIHCEELYEPGEVASVSKHIYTRSNWDRLPPCLRRILAASSQGLPSLPLSQPLHVRRTT